MMYVVRDIKFDEIVGEFQSYEEAEDFVDADQGDHNLEIEEVPEYDI